MPPLADRALDAARRYAKIAPSAPHALHMPSHTFTRVGYWQESIDTNIASARGRASATASTAEELHAMDYRTYAYLQTARTRARAAAARRAAGGARRASTRTPSARPRRASAGVFALAAIPARYALERGAWAEAAALEPQSEPVPVRRRADLLRQALGAARTGDAAGARAAIDALTAIQEQLAAQRETYWAEQAEIQRRAASAWLALAEGRNAEALAEMRAAAALEDAHGEDRPSRPDRWRRRASCSARCCCR